MSKTKWTVTAKARGLRLDDGNEKITVPWRIVKVMRRHARWLRKEFRRR